MTGDTDAAAPRDLAGLRADWPGWDISDGWIAAESGPDRHVWAARRGHVRVTSFSPAGLAGRMRQSGDGGPA